MKHFALPHTPAALRGVRARGPNRGRWPAWFAAATAAPAVLGRPFPATPSRSARPQTSSAPARLRAAVGAPANAAAHWERHHLRTVPWTEGLVLALLIAFFGGGLLAILGGF